MGYVNSEENLAQLRTGSVLYYIGIFFITIRFVCSCSTLLIIPDEVHTLLNVVIISLFIGKLLFQTYSLGRLLSISIFGVICIYSSSVSNEFFLLMSCLAIISGQNVNFNTVIRIMCSTKIILISFQILVYGLDHIFNSSLVMEKVFYRGQEIRYTLYFVHPNTVGLFTLWIIMELFFLHYDSLNLRIILIVSGIVFIVYYFCKSRTLITCYAFAILMIMLSKFNSPFTDKLLAQLSKYIYAICSVVSILFAIIYNSLLNSPFGFLFSSLNKLLSERLFAGSLAYQTFGLTLLGRSINFDKLQFVVDNAYVKIAVETGIIYLVIFSVAFYLVSKSLNKKYQIFIIVYVIYGISESIIINAFLCFPLLLLSLVLFSKGEDVKEFVGNGCKYDRLKYV
jgi:hypothetical protein